jgi:hypothetical protein
MFNSLAMGDVIAGVPVVKYALENYYKDPASYLVVAKEMFRPLFPFVPDANFRVFENKADGWGVPATFAVGVLNQPKIKQMVRNTPKHIHLSQFASLRFLDMVLPLKDLDYVPLETVNVSRYNVDFRESVIFVTSYRDETRAWRADYLLETARLVEKKGYTPVFIGKTDMNLDTRLTPKTSLPAELNIGVDLRNNTTIPELAAIMQQARAVVGLDSGPIHLAGTTKVPIVCGYTSIVPEFRIPIRKKGQTFAVAPKIPCIGCESKWQSHFHNFELCYLKHADCCQKMTPDLFQAPLSQLLKYRGLRTHS